MRSLSDLFRHAVPFRRFVVETSWPATVAVIEIRKRLTEPKLLRLDEEGPFVGTEQGGRFTFRMKVGPQTPFVPVAQVAVRPSHHDGARIEARVRPSGLTAFRMVVLLGMSLFVAWLVGPYGATHGDPVAALLLLAPLLVAVLVGLPYALQSRRLEREMSEIFARAPALPEPPETGEVYRGGVDAGVAEVRTRVEVEPVPVDDARAVEDAVQAKPAERARVER